MSEPKSAVHRLEEQLNEKDLEIDELREKLETSEQMLAGSKTGWCVPVEHPETEEESALPIPRLELIYRNTSYEHQTPWSNYDVIYALVRKHLLGHVVVQAFGHTKIRGGGGREPIQDGVPELPYRDGAHAAHDADHLGLPLYARFPNRSPILVDLKTYDSQRGLGAEHRRERES